MCGVGLTLHACAACICVAGVGIATAHDRIAAVKLSVYSMCPTVKHTAHVIMSFPVILFNNDSSLSRIIRDKHAAGIEYGGIHVS